MNKSHLTAIKRNKLSLPMAYLQKQGLLKGRILDFGCGRGDDANHLDLDKYDPYYFPDCIKGVYSTITCIYVLNVLTKQEIKKVLRNMAAHLSPHGKIYITVRRDLKKTVRTQRGTLQRVIKLDMPILIENKKYCIYYWSHML